MDFDLTLRLLTTVWLGVMAWEDYQHQELPHWGTTLPLVGLSCYNVVSAIVGWNYGGFQAETADKLAVGLSFLAVLLSDHWWSAILPAIGALILPSLQGTVAGQTAAVAWLVALALTKVDIIGAGDAKVVMVLVTLYPKPTMALYIVIGAALLSGLWLLWKRGKNALASLWVTLHTEAPGTRAPGVPLFALGALAYIWTGGLQ